MRISELLLSLNKKRHFLLREEAISQCTADSKVKSVVGMARCRWKIPFGLFWKCWFGFFIPVGVPKSIWGKLSLGRERETAVKTWGCQEAGSLECININYPEREEGERPLGWSRTWEQVRRKKKLNSLQSYKNASLGNGGLWCPLVVQRGRRNETQPSSKCFCCSSGCVSVHYRCLIFGKVII